MLQFEVLVNEGHARRGRLMLSRGGVESPMFVPAGTYGAVKGVMPQAPVDMGAQIILGNKFNRWLRPGLDVLRQFGGLHCYWTIFARIQVTIAGHQNPKSAWVAVLHRHLNHQRYTLAAIDDVISRGRWQEWAELRSGRAG